MEQRYTIAPFEGTTPKIHPSVFIADGARIIGDVEIEHDSSVWYNVVIRGDVHRIRIGSRTNIQDLTMLHVTHKKHSLTIGNSVTVGHSAVLHGANVKDFTLIGMGAVILDNATINPYSLVAAGAVVREGFSVPEGTLVAGVPAKVVRDLTDQERQNIVQSAQNYIDYVARFRAS